MKEQEEAFNLNKLPASYYTTIPVALIKIKLHS